MHPSVWWSNIHEEFTVFDAWAEVLEDISECHFENSFLDLIHFCEPEDVDCSPSNLFHNASQNMFALLGKVTEIGQELSDFPNPD